KELIVILCPFVPHIAEEMWEHIGGKGLCSDQKWPACDEKALVLDEVEIVIQINGKLKDKFVVSKDITREELEKAALESDKVKELTEGKTIVKVIAVPGRLVNLVVK
ncbi:MAG: class I tRNA ligase family protein, partial [Firmicutes bacterium]|nr:class I tRNA ligase family protein [Bacillota bacterium]